MEPGSAVSTIIVSVVTIFAVLAIATLVIYISMNLAIEKALREKES